MVHLHLAHRWYLGYDLGERVPDHSALSKIRDRYGLEVFQRFFEQIVQCCVEAGLVWGQELYFDGTRVGANTHFHLRGGSVRIGPRSEIRDHCVLKTNDGRIETGELFFMSYGCMVHATERVVLEDRVGFSERVSVVDSDHESDGGETHWRAHDLSVEPIHIGANTLLMANAVVTMGAEIGANSQVAANAVVRAGEHPDSVLLAGAPAEVVKQLDDD